MIQISHVCNRWQKKYTVNVEKIKTVYWKTGHHYDADKIVIADKVLDREAVLALLRPYHNDSEILADYINRLCEDMEWDEKHKADYFIWIICKRRF